MGVVYEALDRERGARVALKTLKAWSPDRLYLLKREFRALADLEHENLIRLQELICEQGSWFFTMELLEGTDFLTWVGARPSQDATASTAAPLSAPAQAPSNPPPGPPPRVHEGRLRAGLQQLARGLSALHAAGKVHRDLKPSNIHVTSGGRVVIMDFGLFGEAGAPPESSVAKMGSPSYVAPEQADGAGSPASDWYSVGVILYRAFTGGFPPTYGAALESAPADLSRLCAELLRRDPEQRPTGAEVLDRLGAGSERAALGAAFHGRAAELAALEAALGSSRAQRRPELALVQGDSGIGKSALCRRFCASLPAALVLSGRCYEREQVPFNALDGAIDALSRYLVDASEAARRGVPERALAVLATAFPVLRRALGRAAVAEQPPAENPEKQAAAISAALREVLGALAAAQPLVLWVDDLQWADGDSLGLLRELLSPREGPALLLVGTQRTRPGTEDEAGRALAGRLAREPRTVRLGALGSAEAQALVRSLRAEVEPGQLEEIVREGSGHPLYLQELAWGADRPAHARRLDDALRDRVAGLSPEARRLVELIAVGGAPLRDATLAAAAQASGPAVRAIADELWRHRLVQWTGARADGLLDTWHDRVREAVLAGLGPEATHAHHRALADALEGEGAAEVAPERLLRHLRASDQRDRAAAVALTAARRARAALAFERASEFYRAALECSGAGGAELQALRLDYAESAALAGRGEEAAQACLDAKEGADLATRVELQRLAAEHLLGSGSFARGLEVMRAVLEEIGESWPRNQASLLAAIALGRMRLKLRGYRWRRGEPSEPELLRLRAYRAVGVGLMSISPLLAVAFQTRYLLLALDGGPPELAAEALGMESLYLAMMHGRGHEALLADARRIALEVGPERETRYVVDAGSGICRILTGEVHGGAEELAEALVGWRRAERTPWLINRGVLGLLHARERLGQLSQLAPALDETLRGCAHRGDRLVEETATRAACSVFLARDDAEGLRRRLATQPWVPSEGGYSATMFLDLYARGALALYEGAAREARPALERRLVEYERSFLARTRQFRPDQHWLRGRLALASGLPELRGVAERCASLLQSEERPYGWVWGKLLAAGLAASAGQRERAQELLQQTARAAEPIGMALFAEVARGLEGALAGGPEGEGAWAACQASLAEQGVRRTDRFLALLAPGF